MTINTNITKRANTFIAKGIKAGDTLDAIKVGLYTEFEGLSLGQAAKLVAKYMKDNNLVVKRVGFTALFYDFLKEGKKTEKDVDDFIAANGSDNTKRHAKHYKGVAELTNSLHTK